MKQDERAEYKPEGQIKMDHQKKEIQKQKQGKEDEKHYTKEVIVY
ncbi:hypothetical protein VSK92_10970 [Bacillus swezeyi]